MTLLVGLPGLPACLLSVFIERVVLAAFCFPLPTRDGSVIRLIATTYEWVASGECLRLETVRSEEHLTS